MLALRDENVVISARVRVADLPVYERLNPSIHCVLDGAEAFLLDRRRLVVDDDSYLLINSGSAYGSRIAKGREPLHTFSVHFRHGLAQEAIDALVNGNEAALDARLGTAPVEFIEQLTPHNGIVSPALRQLMREVEDGESDPDWLEEQCAALLVRLLRRHCRIGTPLDTRPRAGDGAARDRTPYRPGDGSDAQPVRDAIDTPPHCCRSVPVAVSFRAAVSRRAPGDAVCVPAAQALLGCCAPADLDRPAARCGGTGGRHRQSHHAVPPDSEASARQPERAARGSRGGAFGLLLTENRERRDAGDRCVPAAYFFVDRSSGSTNPIGRFFGSGGTISSRIASKTCLICARVLAAS